MKANELMIGDWVFRPDCYDKVKEIRYTGIIGIDNLRGLITFSELEPIPSRQRFLKRMIGKKDLLDMFFTQTEKDMIILYGTSLVATPL